MLEKILKLENWARLAGFVTIFLSIIVCSFLYAISYPPLPNGAAVEMVASKKGTPESERYEKESLEKAANERGLTVATWVLAFATLFLFFTASVQVGLFVWQLDLIRESLTDAKKAADAAEQSASAAKLNAQALIDAEAAQMYLVIWNSDIEHLCKLGGMYDNSPTMHSSQFDPPWIEYRLRNYGKSPAIVQSVVHGIFFDDPNIKSGLREYVFGQDAMEIVGVGEQGQVIRCELPKQPFTFGDVRSIVTDDRLLRFCGRAKFMDHFGRKQTLEWELVADNSQWHLISHRNTRETPEGQN